MYAVTSLSGNLQLFNSKRQIIHAIFLKNDIFKEWMIFSENIICTTINLVYLTLYIIMQSYISSIFVNEG